MSAPSVTAVIPTLNAERPLAACLRALREQDYPGAVSVIVADGGSRDATVEIARSFGATVVDNPLRTGEAGKAAGVRAGTGDLILLVDSDNTLVGRDWLARMTAPFEDPEVIASEPIRWEYRRDDHPVNRWHALTGVADPVALFIGNYNRQSMLTGRWTDLPVHEEQRDGWRRVRLCESAMPTVGANGYLVRRTAFEAVPVGDYLFDIDHAYELVRRGHRTMALVDVAIHHDFCDGYRQFVRKTRRRIDDYVYFSSAGERSFPWQSRRRRRGLVEFVLATLMLVPLVKDVLRGMRAVRDPAWWFHPVACWLTLCVYAAGTIRGRLRPAMLDREGYRQ